MEIGILSSFINSLFKIVSLPSFVLYGLTLACYVFLLIMNHMMGNLAIFMKHWEVVILLATVILTCLTILKLLLAIVAHYITSVKSLEKRKALALISRNTPNCFWHLAKQQDGSYVSQINVEVDIANITENSIGVSKVELIKPKKQKTIHAQILLPQAWRREQSGAHKIQPKDKVTASISIITQGTLAPLGRTLPITIGITDQFGMLYTLKISLDPTPDQVLS